MELKGYFSNIEIVPQFSAVRDIDGNLFIPKWGITASNFVLEGKWSPKEVNEIEDKLRKGNFKIVI